MGQLVKLGIFEIVKILKLFKCYIQLRDHRIQFQSLLQALRWQFDWRVISRGTRSPNSIRVALWRFVSCDESVFGANFKHRQSKRSQASPYRSGQLFNERGWKKWWRNSAGSTVEWVVLRLATDLESVQGGHCRRYCCRVFHSVQSSLVW